MKCRVCNRPLTNPRHLQAGLGPVCAKKLGVSFVRAPRKPRLKKKIRRTQDCYAPPLPFEEAATL